MPIPVAIFVQFVVTAMVAIHSVALYFTYVVLYPTAVWGMYHEGVHRCAERFSAQKHLAAILSSDQGVVFGALAC